MIRAPWTSCAPSARPALLRDLPPALRRVAAGLLALSLASAADRARAAEPVAPPGVAAASAALDPAPFEEALDRFVPSLPATTARLFGFTDLGPRPGDAISAPGEVERYAAVTPAPGATALLGQWAARTGTAVATPHRLLRVSGGGALSRAWSAPGSAFAATGWQATIAAPSGPWRGRLSATVAEEVRGTTAGLASRVGTQSTASAQLRPAGPLTLRLEGHRISERGGPGDGVVVAGARAGAGLALVPGVLEVTATGGVDRVRADADAVATGRTSATAGITARLTPALTLSGSTAVQEGVLSGAAAANALFGQLPAARVTTTALAWRATDRLLLSAALSRIETPLGPATARQLRAAWGRGRAGRLGLAAAYEESVDPASGLRTAQAVLQPSVRLGRYAAVEATVTQALRAVAGPASHPLAVLVSLSVRS